MRPSAAASIACVTCSASAAIACRTRVAHLDGRCLLSQRARDPHVSKRASPSAGCDAEPEAGLRHKVPGPGLTRCGASAWARAQALRVSTRSRLSTRLHRGGLHHPRGSPRGGPRTCMAASMASPTAHLHGGLAADVGQLRAAEALAAGGESGEVHVCACASDPSHAEPCVRPSAACKAGWPAFTVDAPCKGEGDACP